jgi:hypothetical protein
MKSYNTWPFTDTIIEVIVVMVVVEIIQLFIFTC